MGIKFNVNGKAVDVKAEADTPLLWVIRDEVGLTGTKFGCGASLCGACTVHLDGVPVRSCQTPVSAAAGRKVSTIESLSHNNSHPLQKAWIAHDVPQCGYCQSGHERQHLPLRHLRPRQGRHQDRGRRNASRLRSPP